MRESNDCYMIRSFCGASFSTQSSFVTLRRKTRIPRSIIQIGNYGKVYREGKFRIQIICHETFWGLYSSRKLNSKSKHCPRKGTRTLRALFPFLMFQLMFSSCIHLLFMRQTSKLSNKFHQQFSCLKFFPWNRR